MKIIPNEIYYRVPNSEVRVFNKLKESFYGNNKYFALHSLNLTNHHKKRFAEADFVIVCEFGVYVLEVKGNTVRCEDGIWYQKKSDNEYKRLNESPMVQAEGAMHAINKVIKKEYNSTLNLSIGFGVIFPDVEWETSSAEVNNQTVCDSRNIKNFENWLSEFIKYWTQKVVNKNYPKLCEQDINSIIQLLRPNFELIEPLHTQLDRIEEIVVQLTKDQYKLLDIVSANKKVLCSGGAGTGKTFLAKELGRRKAKKDNRVVLVCKSKWLKRYLEPRIQNEFLNLSTIDSLKTDMKRSGIEKYDVLIVDEGQDIFNLDDIFQLDEILIGGLSTGEWYIFHDVNNQSGLFGSSQNEVIEMLESYNPANVPLTTNCRNTGNILKNIKSSLKLDMGNKGTIIGPAVQEYISKNEEEGKKIMYDIIENYISGGVSPGEITILSVNKFEDSITSKLPVWLKDQIKPLDEYSVRDFPLEKISFSEIKNFKGLENKIIIVIDLIKPSQLKSISEKVHHYVGMSRARDLLCTIWCS
jgi:hypothetical protein